MSSRTWCAVCACAVTALAPGSVVADEHPWSGAYVSVVSGAARLEASDARSGEDVEAGMPLAEGDRLASGRGGFIEIAFRSGATVWLDVDTDVLLQRIFAGPALLLDQGALFVHVPAYAAGDASIDIVDTGGVDARISVRPGGLACVKPGGTFPIVVDLWNGQAAVAAFGSSVSMSPAQRVRLGSAREFLVSDFITEPGTRFEVQSLARLRRIEAAGRDYLERPLQGIDALEDYGRWYYDTEFSARVWRPYVTSAWRPFYNGRWLHHPRGAYWLAHDPWGGVTYQYGRWRYSRRGYWCWVPGYAFTPAAVRFYSSGDYVVWVPLGMHTRFTYGTWWPDDYYRYAVMCRRGSLYKARGTRCSPGRHRGRGHGDCGDDRFERPKPGSRRDVQAMKPDALPEPKPRRTPVAAPRPLEPASEIPVPGQPQRAPRMPERRQGNLQVVPVVKQRPVPPEDRMPAPVVERPGRGPESSGAHPPVVNPRPDRPRPAERDVHRWPGDIRPTPEMPTPRRSFDRPAPAEAPPGIVAPQTGGGQPSGGSAPRRLSPAYRPQPRMPSPAPGTEPRSGR